MKGVRAGILGMALACAAAPGLGAAGRPLDVRVTGGNHSWSIRYEGADGRLDTADDVVQRRHLRLPARTRVRLDLRSDDFVYSFILPALDVRDLAVPGRPFSLEFETEGPGVTPLRGDQMCGFTHPELMGDLIVLAPGEFRLWMAAPGEHTTAFVGR